MSNKNRFKVVEVTRGRCLLREEARIPQCYVCDRPAPAWPWPDGYAVVAYGCASINGDSLVPLCEACFVADSTTSIVRKFLNARTQGSQKAGM
jgi:hypothetical protein